MQNIVCEENLWKEKKIAHKPGRRENEDFIENWTNLYERGTPYCFRGL